MRLMKSILRLLSVLLPIYLLSILMLVFANLLIFTLYKTLFWSWPAVLLLGLGLMILMLGLLYLFDRVGSVETVNDTKAKPDNNDDLIGFLTLFCVFILAIMPIVVLYLKMK